jgi:hypothetical protein
MPWWLWSVPVLGILLFLLWRMRQPKHQRHVRFHELERYMGRFLSQGESGSVMVMEREYGAGFFQLELIENGIDRILEFGLPDVVWTGDVFTQVERSLLSAGFSPRVERATDCSKVRRFMRVPVSVTGQRAAEETQYLLAVAAAALGWGTDGRFTVRFEGKPTGFALPGRSATLAS